MPLSTLSRIREFDLLARSLILLLGSVSLVVTSATWRPSWDELNYLHRAVCVNRTLFAGDFAGAHQCMLNLLKAPVMMLLLLPFGQIGDNADLIRLAPVMLAVISFGAVLAIALLSWKLRISLVVVLIALIGVVANPLTQVVGGAFLIDTFLSFLVAVVVLLFAFEASSTAPSSQSAVIRGTMWGLLGTAGIMSKLTFGYFMVLLFVPMLGIVWRREGFHRVLMRGIGAFVVSIPGLIVFFLYSNQYFAHAYRASFGPIAQFYSDGMSLSEFVSGQINATALGGRVLLLTALIAGAAMIRRRSLDLVPIYLLLVLLGYFWLTANTVNRDARFLVPFWMALPWCLALFMRKRDDGELRGWPARDLALAGLAAVFLSLPAIKAFDLSVIEQSRKALQAIPADRSGLVLTATDSADFNIESVLLAYQLDRAHLPASLSIDTLVYDIPAGRTLEQTIERMRTADVVMFRLPLDPNFVPEWPNRNAKTLLSIAQAEGKDIAAAGPPPSVHLFLMPSSDPTARRLESLDREIPTAEVSRLDKLVANCSSPRGPVVPPYSGYVEGFDPATGHLIGWIDDQGVGSQIVMVGSKRIASFNITQRQDRPAVSQVLKRQGQFGFSADFVGTVDRTRLSTGFDPGLDNNVLWEIAADESCAKLMKTSTFPRQVGPWLN